MKNTAYRRSVLIVLVLPGLLSACDTGSGGLFGNDTFAGSDLVAGDATADAGTDPDLGSPDADACPGCPGPGDGPRKVIFGLPYDDAGAKATTFGSGTLDLDGSLILDPGTFSMGRAPYGHVLFTPDGRFGLVAQEAGNIGVLRIVAGAIEVVHAAFSGDFYASTLVMHPDGNRAFAIDSSWAEGGGGVYGITIGSDGTLSDDGLVIATKLLRGLVFLPDGSGEALAGAAELLGSPAADSLHLLTTGPGGWGRVSGADAFGDDEYILSAMALSADARFALMGDNSLFSGLPNRLAVVGIAGDTLTPVQVLSPVRDPVDIAVSPFDGQALVLSGMGDDLLRLSYDPDAAEPYALIGEVTYQGQGTALPVAAVVIDSGPLRGLVLVSENTGIRRLRFEPDGGLTDLGIVDTGDGNAGIPGAIGVQP